VATPLLVDFKEREPQMKQLRAKIARSQAAEVAREARSERTSRAVPETGRTAQATVVMKKIDSTATDTADADLAADTADDDGPGAAPAAAPAPARAGVGGAPRRPTKRSNRGRPSGKKRR
jgi:preprotein translocase subunit SecF